MTNFSRIGLGLTSVIAALSFSQTADAQVTIVRNFAGGSAPTATGTGNLQTVFNAACDWWEAALVTSPYTLTLTYQWGSMGGGTLAAHSLVSQGGTPHRETAGSITFDNDGSTNWFIDSTPCDPSEYTTFTTNTTNYGGGLLIDENVWTGATGPAAGQFDLFRTALHEVGHALGLSSANTAFQAERTDNDVDVTSPRPFPGSSLPLSSTSAHMAVGSMLMCGGCATQNQRRYPSEGDLLANAQISQMSGINFLTACPGTGGGGSPLTTTFANNNGGAVGGAVYFALEGVAGGGGATITDIDLNCAGFGGLAGTIDVYMQNGCSFDHLGVWGGPIATGSATTAAAGSPTNFVLSSPIEIGEGCCVSIAIVAGGFGHAYTTGTSPFALTYATTHLELTAGSATNAPFAGSAFNPRVVNANFHYTVGGTCPPSATVETIGTGCVANFESVYEIMDTASFDLSGQEFTATNSASGYSIAATPTAGIIAPGAIGTPTTLVMPDDGQVPAGTLGIVVGSNGWIALGGGNSNGFVPSAGTMLNNPSTAIYAWTDLQPNNSGTVTYEENAATGRVRVTFDDVHGWNTTDDHDIQFDYNVNNGNWQLRFGAVGFANPEDWLVGYSPGGANSDPGSTDLTLAALFAIETQAADTIPLSLEAVGTPVLGAPFMLTTNGIEPTAIFHVGIVGLTQVSLPLSFVFTQADPTCFLNASLDLVMGPDIIFGGPGSHTWEGVDLTTGGAVGFDLYFTSATLDLTVLSNSTRTANGIKATTGIQ